MEDRADEHCEEPGGGEATRRPVRARQTESRITLKTADAHRCMAGNPIPNGSPYLSISQRGKRPGRLALS